MPRDLMINGATIQHIDLAKSLRNNQDLCFQNDNGVVKITLKKDFGENLVTVLK